jgi:hypothetical protein
MITDRLVDQKKKGNPFTIFGKNFLSPFSFDSYKYIEAYLRHYYSNTAQDMFYFLSRMDLINHELLFERQNDQTIYSRRDFLFSMNFMLDDKRITYYRSYDSILNILGNIGGLKEVLFFFCSLVLGPLN